MADFNLDKFVNEIQSIAEIRNLDPFNPIVIHIQHPSSNVEFRIIAAIVEPSRYLTPTNGIWVMLDPTSSYYRKVLRCTNPNVATAPFNATWIEIFSQEDVFSLPQYFDILQGPPGVPGEPGEAGQDSLIPGPPGPQGIQGPAGNAGGVVVATGVVLTSNSLIFAVAKDLTATPDAIIFTARLENLEGTVTFSTLTGDAVVVQAGNTATLSYADMQSDVATIRASFTADDGSVYTDDETVAKVREGSDAITMLLTNETVTLPADEEGVVGSYVGASTDVLVYQGATNVTASWSLAKADSAGITSTLTGKTVTINNLTAEAAYVDITASRIGFDSVTRRFSASIAKRGSPGVGSYELILNPDIQVFTVDNLGVSSPESIKFTATLKNITGSPTFEVINGTAQLTVAGPVATVNFATMATETITVRASLEFNGQTFSDESTIAKLYAGTDGITALLTNETDTIPADADGTPLNFTGAETEMIIYEGAVNKTADWTFTKTDSVGFTTTILGNKVTATGMLFDVGYADIKAQRTGADPVTKRFSLSKSKAGRDGSGANAFNVILSTTSQIFAIAKDGTNSPGSITFSALLQNITGTPIFTVSDGTGNLVVLANIATLDFLDMTSDTLTVKVEVTDDTTSVVYEDYATVVKLREGSDAVVAFLSNESASLQADADGLITDFTGASTDMFVFVGTEDTTALWTYLKEDSADIVSTLVNNMLEVTALTGDSGYVDITASRAGFPSVTKRFTLVRTKDGRDGSIKGLIIGADSQIFAVSKVGVASPSVITITARLSGLTGTPTFELTDGTALLAPSGNTATLNYSDMSTDTITVKASLTDEGITYDDSITLAKIRDGSDSITALLTNETVTLPSDSLGVVSSYTGASTKMVVYIGILDTTAQWVFTKADSEGLVTNILGNTVTVSSLDVDQAYSDITAARVGFPSVTKRFSISKVKAGSDGSSVSLILNSDAQVFVVDKDNNSSLPEITFEALLNNMTGVPLFEIEAGDATISPVAGQPNKATIAYTSMTTETVTVKVSVFFEGITYEDKETIAKIYNGSDAVNAILTNENVTLSANSSGVVSSYAGASTQMKVYEGSDDKTAEWTITRADSAGVVSSISVNTITVTALTADVAYVDITASKGGFSSITKRMSLTRSKAGADGNAQLLILNSSSQIFAVDKLLVGAPSSITMTAVLQNITGTVTFAVIAGTGTITNTATTATITYANMATDTITVRASLTMGGITFSDDMTIAKIRAGVDSITALLTNETASVPADVNGVVTSFAGIQSRMNVYQGVTDVTSQYTYAKVDGPSVTSVMSSNNVTVTTMTADTAYVDLVATRVGFATITKRFSLTKTKTGAAGVNGLSALLTNETFVFNADNAGVVTNYSGATSTMKILNGPVDDSANWNVTKSDSSGVTSTLSGKTVTVTGMTKATLTGWVILTATRSGFPTLTREFSVAKSKAGEAGTPGTAGSAGVNGKRGSRTFYVPGQATWSDAAANTASSVEQGPILNDIVTEYNTPTGFSQTRFWSGSAWTLITQVVDGNLLVKGTVGATQIAANAIKAGSAIIEVGALGTLMIAGNAVTQVLSGLQNTDPSNYQKAIPVSTSWTEFMRYSNALFSGTQPIIVWGACNTVSIHQYIAGETIPPGQPEETYSGIRWISNYGPAWYDIRVTLQNVSTGTLYHFVCQAGVWAGMGETKPATINALFPPVPAGTYHVIVSCRVVPVAGHNMQGIGVRSGQVAILETKR